MNDEIDFVKSYRRISILDDDLFLAFERNMSALQLQTERIAIHRLHESRSQHSMNRHAAIDDYGDIFFSRLVERGISDHVTPRRLRPGLPSVTRGCREDRTQIQVPSVSGNLNLGSIFPTEPPSAAVEAWSAGFSVFPSCLRALRAFVVRRSFVFSAVSVHARVT